MFSSDSNIESIAQFVEEIKKYVTLKSEDVRLGIVEKTVKLLTVTTVTIILTALLLLALIYLSFALAFAIGNVLGNVLGFLIVGCAYMVVLITFCIFRKEWVERPLVRFLASLLME